LIFIYPVWWQNMPAILKGFVDRIFVARFSFVYENALPKKLLKGRRAIVLTSSSGPRIYSYFFKGDRAIKVLTKDMLEFCGIKSKGFMIGIARDLNNKKKRKIEKMVSRGLKFLL
jgi:NAD(P)H dehydrogenase (quinone)